MNTCILPIIIAILISHNGYDAYSTALNITPPRSLIFGNTLRVCHQSDFYRCIGWHITSKSKHSLSVSASTVFLSSSSNANQFLREEWITTAYTDEFSFDNDLAERILQLNKRGEGRGYYTVDAADRVVDVMRYMAKQEGTSEDVALVFDDNGGRSLVGLFTQTDYNFNLKTAGGSKAELVNFLVSPVSQYVTQKENLIGISTINNSNMTMALMQKYKTQHLILSDIVTLDNRLTDESIVKGVIHMQDVMSLIYKEKEEEDGHGRLSSDSILQQQVSRVNKENSASQYLMRTDGINTKSYPNLMIQEPGLVQKYILHISTVVLSALTVGSFLLGSEWLHVHANLVMIAIFISGYIAIIFEEVFHFNKGAIALLMSTGLWVTYADFFGNANGIASTKVIKELGEQLAQVSDICFFLLAASTIVQVVDDHQGFKVVTDLITTKSKKWLFWTIGFLTFFLSAILNNLTVTIVMCSLLRKLVPLEEERKLFGAMVVVAANAGGVWTPIGDVTTSMLWINNQLSTIPTIMGLFLPSMACFMGSLYFLSNQVQEDKTSVGDLTMTLLDEPLESTQPAPHSPRFQLVFWSGIASLLFVPVFSEFTGLPPYLAMLTSLGAIWMLTDILHMDQEEEKHLRVPSALTKLDMSGILFFFGVLMSIGVLDKSGLLKDLATFLNENLPNQDIIATVIGIASALIDNVPLVAATMGMYDLEQFGTDDKLWQLIALCAGTGGSILLIGSASGVALMGLEKVDFLWYAKKVSVGAMVGYFAGIVTYISQNALLHEGVFNILVPHTMVSMLQHNL